MQTQHFSKITSQGQISVPAAVRNSLGLKPGSMLEWAQRGDEIVVRRAVRCNTDEVHEVLFPEQSVSGRAKTAQEMRQGIVQLMRSKHARP